MKILCGLCYDSKTQSEMFTIGVCNHRFCRECVTKHVVARTNQNILKVNCPETGCNVELKPECLQDVLPGELLGRWNTLINNSLNCELQELKNSEKDEAELDRKLIELAKREMWQRCPKCSFYVERLSGCEHIACRCGCNFCHMCGHDWEHGHLAVNSP